MEESLVSTETSGVSRVPNPAGNKGMDNASTLESHRTSFQGTAHISIAHITMENGFMDLPYDVGCADTVSSLLIKPTFWLVLRKF